MKVAAIYKELKINTILILLANNNIMLTKLIIILLYYNIVYYLLLLLLIRIIIATPLRINNNENFVRGLVQSSREKINVIMTLTFYSPSPPPPLTSQRLTQLFQKLSILTFAVTVKICQVH